MLLIIMNIVLDIHPAWCGPCELMNPTYKTMSTTIDDFEKRLEFCTVIFLKNIDINFKLKIF